MGILTQTFLAEVFPAAGYIEIRALRGKEVRRGFSPAVPEALAFVSTLVGCGKPGELGYDIYFGVAARATTLNGSKHNLAYANALWADIDQKKLRLFPSPRQALQAFPLAPSIVVKSGTGDNLHAYWLLDEPFDLRGPEAVATFESYLKGLAKALEADSASTDASRVLRLPNTLNHKSSPPSLVEVVDWHPERRYALHEFPQVAVQRPTDEVEIGVAIRPSEDIWVPGWVQDILDHGYVDCWNKDHSAVDFKVVTRLLEKGFRPEEVLWLVIHAPAIGQRRADWARYWPLTIKNAVRRRGNSG